MVVFDLADHEHPKPMRAVAGAFYHHQAVWAPDSLSLAVLQSQDGDLARDFAPVVVVADLSGKASPIAVPRGLRPVSLSW